MMQYIPVDKHDRCTKIFFLFLIFSRDKPDFDKKTSIDVVSEMLHANALMTKKQLSTPHAKTPDNLIRRIVQHEVNLEKMGQSSCDLKF